MELLKEKLKINKVSMKSSNRSLALSNSWDLWDCSSWIFNNWCSVLTRDHNSWTTPDHFIRLQVFPLSSLKLFTFPLLSLISTFTHFQQSVAFQTKIHDGQIEDNYLQEILGLKLELDSTLSQFWIELVVGGTAEVSKSKSLKFRV